MPTTGGFRFCSVFLEGLSMLKKSRGSKAPEVCMSCPQQAQIDLYTLRHSQHILLSCTEAMYMHIAQFNLKPDYYRIF